MLAAAGSGHIGGSFSGIDVIRFCCDRTDRRTISADTIKKNGKSDALYISVEPRSCRWESVSEPLLLPAIRFSLYPSAARIPTALPIKQITQSVSEDHSRPSPPVRRRMMLSNTSVWDRCTSRRRVDARRAGPPVRCCGPWPMPLQGCRGPLTQPRFGQGGSDFSEGLRTRRGPGDLQRCCHHGCEVLQSASAARWRRGPRLGDAPGRRRLPHGGPRLNSRRYGTTIRSCVECEPLRFATK